MVRLLGNTKVSLLSFVYCLCIVLYAGMATLFTRDLGNITTVGNAFGLALTLLVILVHRITPDRKFWRVLLVFFLYGLATTINQGRFSLLWLSKWPILFLIAYTLCHDLKDKLFITIETVIVLLCLVSLVLWTVQTISPSAIYSIVKQFEFSVPYSDEAKIEGNMVVFTLNTTYANKEFLGLFPRNAGFAWEPGAFGSYICMGLFCNMLRKGLTLKNNLPFILMLVTLLTTQSTTALAAFVIGLVIWLFAGKKVTFYSLLMIPLVVWIYTLPFVSEKAMNQYEDAIGYTVDQIDLTQDMNRIQSFVISWQEFLHHPILGLGGDAGGSWLRQEGYDVPIFSGIGELLSRYGIIMTVLFFVVMFKSAKKMNESFQTKSAYAFIGIFICIMIGFNNWNAPIYMVFWLYAYFGYTSRVQSCKPKLASDISGFVS